jgi:hypothetical protein
LAGAKVTAAFLDINQKGVVSTAPARTIVILTFLDSGGMMMMITEWIPVIVVRTVQERQKLRHIGIVDWTKIIF